MTDTNPYHEDKDIKQAIYQDNIRRCLEEAAARLEHLASALPEAGETFNLNALTPEQTAAVQSINAIEGEWIIDPATRAKQSILQNED